MEIPSIEKNCNIPSLVIKFFLVIAYIHMWLDLKTRNNPANQIIQYKAL